MIFCRCIFQTQKFQEKQTDGWDDFDVDDNDTELKTESRTDAIADTVPSKKAENNPSGNQKVETKKQSEESTQDTGWDDFDDWGDNDDASKNVSFRKLL